MDVRQFFEQVRKLDELIDAKNAERLRLIEIATDISPAPSDGMPHSNTGVVKRKVENAVIDYVMLEVEVLDGLIHEYESKKAIAVAIMQRLPSDEFGALHRYYIQRKKFRTWPSVAEDMGYSERQIHRIKDKGLWLLGKFLKNVQDVIECHDNL